MNTSPKDTRMEKKENLETFFKMGYERGFIEGKESVLPSDENDLRKRFFREAGEIIAECVRDAVDEWKGELVWKQPYATNRLHRLHHEIQESLEKAYTLPNKK